MHHQAGKLSPPESREGHSRRNTESRICSNKTDHWFCKKSGPNKLLWLSLKTLNRPLCGTTLPDCPGACGEQQTRASGGGREGGRGKSQGEQGMLGFPAWVRRRA